MKKETLIWQALFLILIVVLGVFLFTLKQMLAYKFYTDCLLRSEEAKVVMDLTCADILKK